MTPSEHSLLVNEPLRQRYESSWTSGSPLALSECLPEESSSQYLPTLEELLHIQLEFAWKAHAVGTRPRPASVNSLLDEFPALRNPEVLIRLLRQEFDCRTRAGDAPSAEDYRRDFPDLDLDRLTVAPGDTIGPTATDDTATIPPPAADAATIPPPPADAATIPPPPTGSNPSEDQTLQSAVSFVEAATPPEIQLEGYEILGELGRGGMGVVYRALDVRLKRVVALKMILAGVHADPEDLKRFQLEAEAVAQLQHPNIVQIHDVGEHEGKPYFSLEFVEGGELATQIAGEPQPPDEAARLVETLSRAMQFAHERNIIHRDLKPANVLLTADGQPKITDFGLAKRLEDDSGQTASGSIMGTPSYMAPEQAGGHQAQIGPQTDVYALGALLYCLLTGRPPFQSANVMDTVLQVLEQEPVPPRQLVTGLDRNLETITLKCLQKDPARRYQAAEEVAEELRRYLNDEPILARPVGIAERTWRWCRRKPAIAGLCAAVVLLLSFVTVNGYLQAEIQRELTGQALTQKAKANENFDLARGAVDRFMTEVSESQLLTVPRMEPLRRKLLTGAMEFYEKFVQQAQDDPELKAALGKSHRKLGRILAILGDDERSVEGISKAIEIFTQLSEENPGDRETSNNLARSSKMLGIVLHKLGRNKEATEALERAIAVASRLVKDSPTVPEHAFELANAKNSLGILLREESRAKEALANYNSAITIAKQLVDDHPQNLKFRGELGNVYHNLGALLCFELSQFAESAKQLEQARAVYQQLAEDEPENPKHIYTLAIVHGSLGNLAHRSGQPAQALEFSRQSRDLFEQVARAHPDVPNYTAKVATANGNLSLVLHRSGKMPEAVTAVEKSRDVFQQLSEKFPDVPEYTSGVARSHNNLGVLLQNSKQPKKAIAAFRRAQEIYEQLATDQPDIPGFANQLAGIHRTIAGILDESGQTADSAAEFSRAITIATQLSKKYPDIPEYANSLASTLNDKGVLLSNTNQRPAAVAEYDRARKVLEQLAKDHPDSPDYASSLANQYDNLGSTHRKMGQLREAAEALNQAITIGRRLVDGFPESPSHAVGLAMAYKNRADVHRDNRQLGLADKALEQQRMIYERLVKDYPDEFDYIRRLVKSMGEIALSLHSQGQSKEAANVIGRAIKIDEQLCKDHPTADHVHRLTINLRNLSLLNTALKRPDEAQAPLERAAELLQDLVKDHPTSEPFWNTLSSIRANSAELSRASGKIPAATRHTEGLVSAFRTLAKINPRNPNYVLKVGTHSLVLADLYQEQGEAKPTEKCVRDAERAFASLYKNEPNTKFLGQRVALSRLRIAELSLARGDHAAAAAMAMKVDEVRASYALVSQRYSAAKILARAVAVASRDPMLKPEQRTRQADQHGQAAMKMIQVIRERRFFTKPENVEKFLEDADFKPLHGRKDYQMLVESLKTPSPKSGKTPSTP